jgi:hypothetical protein
MSWIDASGLAGGVAGSPPTSRSSTSRGGIAPTPCGIIQQFGKDYGSAYAAYGANLMMSALFLVMLLRRGDTRGQSVWIGIFKMLGTLGTSISQSLYDPKTTALNVIYVEIFLLDALYVWLLKRAPRWQRAPA